MELNDLNRAFDINERDQEIMIHYHGRKIRVSGGVGSGFSLRETKLETKTKEEPKKSSFDYNHQNQMLASFLCIM